MGTDTPPRDRLRRAWHITGQVQGVGFRPFVYRLATELDLAGAVGNDAGGVTLEAWGRRERLDELERRLITDAPDLATVDSVRRVDERLADRSPDGFRIIESDRAPAPRGRVTVDAATCVDCRRELLDGADRRHRHALINCTNCGPRYTIVRDLPYDRPLTTMAGFPMCGPCGEEYSDPADRRFHAQPTCCPDCGPRLALLDAAGTTVDGDPTRAAAAILGDGGVVAMKGLGGYHLVADARSEAAVTRLRGGKRRDHKPFAVMVDGPETARALVQLSDAAAALLQSPISPIVLARRSDEDQPIAASVAPGSHRLGVMLPYTPMQHLLFAEGCGPLVMTSANRSDDPLISDDEEARTRLRGICDAWLAHDRPIERAVDDSIVIDAPFGILPVRRARGYVPTPLALPVAAPRPGLCVGGELKGAVAVVSGGDAVIGQHLGDLTYALAYRRFERTIDDLQRLFDVDPQWVACDAHPMYASHRFARRLAEQRGIDLVVVQHHHAHLASLLAESGRNEPVVGLICDGVGFGEDGAAWGGEILVGDLSAFERLGRLRPLRLPGGDAAAKRTGRCGLSWLLDAAGPAGLHGDHARRALPDDAEREAVQHLLEADLNCPISSGMGRLFDAAASVLGLCDLNHHEAMSGLAMEAAAAWSDDRPRGDGVILIDEGAGPGFELDHRPLLHRLVSELTSGRSVESLAWLFHDAVADALARAAARAAAATGARTVGLSGGVFCNTLLTERLLPRLERAGLEALVHRHVPPNDGGLAYGQAAIAAATMAAAGK